MEAIAKTRHLKGSPRKARLVIDLIRGRNVSQALNILKFTDKRAAEPIEKTLRSAIANATYLAEKQNIAIDPDDLFVKTCFVDMGAHKNRRRMRPAPQGRAFREQRHYCHITILVSSETTATDTKSGKKSLQTSPEKGDGGVKGKDAPKLEATKKAKKTSEVKETRKAKAEDAPKAKTPKKAKVEKPAAIEPVQERMPVAETLIVPQETPIVSDPVAEMMDTKKAPEVEVATEDLLTEKPKVEAKTETPEASVEVEKPKTEDVTISEKSAKSEAPKSEATAKPKVETPKVEAATENKAEKVEVPAETKSEKVVEPKIEVKSEERSAKVETKPELPDEAKQGKVEIPNEPADILEMDSPSAKGEDKEAADILEMEVPRDEKAAKKDAKADAEIANAKNVQTQTPAKLNETKKADEAQLDENDILELQ